MSWKELVRWLTVILLCVLHQRPVLARPNIAPTQPAGTIFNDALNSEIGKDEVPPPDTLQATTPIYFEPTYPIDVVNAPHTVYEVPNLSTDTYDEVSLTDERAEDNTTEDNKTILTTTFEEITSVENSTDVALEKSQMGNNLDADVTQEILSTNSVNIDVTTSRNIPIETITNLEDTITNFENTKIMENIPMEINKELIKLEEEIIKDNLHMNPLLYSSSFVPLTTTTESIINFEESKIMEDFHRGNDENLLEELAILETIRNAIEEEATENYIETTEDSLKFTMDADELTSIESIFGDFASEEAASLNYTSDELENVSDIFTKSTFSTENNNDEYTDVPNGSVYIDQEISVTTPSTEEHIEDNKTTPEKSEDIKEEKSEESHNATAESESFEESIDLTEESFIKEVKPAEHTINPVEEIVSITENTIYTTKNSIKIITENTNKTYSSFDEDAPSIKDNTTENNTTEDNTTENNTTEEFTERRLENDMNVTEDTNTIKELVTTTEESTHTTKRNLQNLDTRNEESDQITTTETPYLIPRKIDIPTTPEFSLFPIDSPTVNPLDFEDLEQISAEIDEDKIMAYLYDEYLHLSTLKSEDISNISEEGSGDDFTSQTTENSQIISEEVVGNGRFDRINIIDLISQTVQYDQYLHPTTENFDQIDENVQFSTHNVHTTEQFIVHFDQEDETPELVNLSNSKKIEDNIVHVENETEEKSSSQHVDMYNPKPVEELEDNILNLLPIPVENPSKKETKQTTTESFIVKLPSYSDDGTEFKTENIIEAHKTIENSKAIGGLDIPVDEKENVSNSQVDEEYEKQTIIDTSEHSTVVEYRHSDSADICFEGSIGYQLIANIRNKDGDEKTLSTPKYKDSFKKKCVNSKFPVLRITQNYTSIELRFRLDPGYLFVDEISAMISFEGQDYQALSSDSDLFISLLEKPGILRSQVHKEFISERSKPEGTSMNVTFFDVELIAHTSNNHERIFEGTTSKMQDQEVNDDDEPHDESVHTIVLVVTILLSIATLIIVIVLLVKIVHKYKSKKMVYILSVR